MNIELPLHAVDPRQIETLLKVGSLDKAEATRRALLLASDLDRINFEIFKLSCRPYRIPSGDGRLIQTPLAEYHFGDTGFGVHNARNSKDNISRWIGGTGLDRGHLQFFSKVSDIGHRIIPHFWLDSKKLRSQVRNPSQHLDTLEEVWWLGRWLGMEEIRHSEPMRKCLASDVDWQFVIAKTRSYRGLKVNLEVKRLKRDNLRHSRQLLERHHFAQFCRDQVLSKFQPSLSDEVNVLAISLFGEIDRNVQSVVSNWLLGDENSCPHSANKEKLIDAVLLATRESRRQSSFDMQLRNEKARLIKPYLLTPDAEDESFFFVFEVPRALAGLP
ncbi:MAG: hypothetical protein M3119_06485 [Verrucomicrobiota bacterium]|nr:hypothetical protein [Verrucomicrobiota bacterium]